MLKNKINNDRNEITFVRSVDIRCDKMPLLGGKCYWAYYIQEFGIGSTGETKKIAESNLVELVASIYHNEDVVVSPDRFKVIDAIQEIDYNESKDKGESIRKMTGIDWMRFGFADKEHAAERTEITADSLKAIQKDIEQDIKDEVSRSFVESAINRSSVITTGVEKMELVDLLSKKLEEYGLIIDGPVIVADKKIDIKKLDMHKARLVLIGDEVCKNTYGPKGEEKDHINLTIDNYSSPLTIHWVVWRDDMLKKIRGDNAPW